MLLRASNCVNRARAIQQPNVSRLRQCRHTQGLATTFISYAQNFEDIRLWRGINTYYLAEEHLALKPAFDIPPCNLDGFQLCKGHKFSRPINDADQQISAALQRAEQAEAQLHAMQNSRT